MIELNKLSPKLWLRLLGVSVFCFVSACEQRDDVIVPTPADLSLVENARPSTHLPELNRPDYFDLYWQLDASKPFVLVSDAKREHFGLQYMLRTGQFARFESVREVCAALKRGSNISSRNYFPLNFGDMPGGQFMELQSLAARRGIAVHLIPTLYDRIR